MPPDRTQDVEHIHYLGSNESWTYTDRAGHVHRYDDRYEPLTGTCYPTLVRRSRHVDCLDPECGCDGYEDNWLACHLCGEVICPATWPKVYYMFLGFVHSIDGVPVTEEDYRRRLAGYQAAMKAERKPSGGS
jgi:hypothetical protein